MTYVLNNIFKFYSVVAVLSGGNIDTSVFSCCLERGLAVDGQLLKFSVDIQDQPGTIAEVCNLCAEIGVSIRKISEERQRLNNSDVFSITVS